MCRGAFISVVFGFLVHFSAAYKERQNSDKQNQWIKLQQQKRDIIYIYEKVQMHSYSLKCQSDQHRLMVDTCLSMTF